VKISRRWIAALAVTLMAAGGVGAAFGTAGHSHSQGGRDSAGGSWFSVADGTTSAA